MDTVNLPAPGEWTGNLLIRGGGRAGLHLPTPRVHGFALAQASSPGLRQDSEQIMRARKSMPFQTEKVNEHGSSMGGTIAKQRPFCINALKYWPQTIYPGKSPPSTVNPRHLAE